MKQAYIVKGIAFVLMILAINTSAEAQGFTVSGQLKDAEGTSFVQGATISLKSIRDTTIFFTSYSDTAGRFQFDAVLADSFRLTVSSVGFESLSQVVKVEAADVALGLISLSRSSKELTGVTVTTTTPPATQKGDTVQFNASQFKVNPDASAEDLARKIPGISVENGQVKANGEVVQKVTIDGRELFGDDATAALRTLPAEIVDKIQVFDRLSDQAQLSGIDDGNAQRGINIVTKANMRNGQFGRVFAGYGTNERYAAGGNSTFLKENRKISIVGNFNNVNQQNFASQDLLGVSNNGQNSGRQGGGGGRPQQGGRGGGGGNFGGGNNNFLVGQQNGINKTNAFGINYA
ncbi:MAG TPA: carboxypeptidase-like regulatory domain-containing protein, partial [Flavisolibacter sp.]